MFDTGSFLIWAKAVDYIHTSCDGGPAQGSITYLDGSAVKGFKTKAEITIESLHGDFEITMAQTVSCIRHRSDGIMGLGLTSTILNGRKGIFSYLIDSSDNSGQIGFNLVDLNRFNGYPHWIPVTGSSFWTIKTRIFSQGVTHYTGDTLVDTGTSLVVLSTAEAESINSKLGLEMIPFNSLYGKPCTEEIWNLPPLMIEIHGKIYEWTAREYLFIMPIKNKLYCISGIQGSDKLSKSYQGILGNIFLRKYYTIFDYERKKIGFGIADRSNVTSMLVGSDQREIIGVNSNAPYQPKQSSSRVTQHRSIIFLIWMELMVLME